MSAFDWLILAPRPARLVAVAFVVLRRRRRGGRRDRHQGQAMKLLMTASQINGLPVVTVRGGEDVAEVRDVIYNPEAGRLVGLTLNKRGFFSGRRKEVLPAEAIHAIGRDAVMILDDSSLTAPEDAPDDVGHPATERNVIGDDVLTEGGRSLGVVRDLALLVGSTGEVVGYQIEKAHRRPRVHPPARPAGGVRRRARGPRRHRGVRPRRPRRPRRRGRRLPSPAGAGMSDSFRQATGRKVISRASARELGAVEPSPRRRRGAPDHGRHRRPGKERPAGRLGPAERLRARRGHGGDERRPAPAGRRPGTGRRRRQAGAARQARPHRARQRARHARRRHLRSRDRGRSRCCGSATGRSPRDPCSAAGPTPSSSTPARTRLPSQRSYGSGPTRERSLPGEG